MKPICLLLGMFTFSCLAYSQLQLKVQLKAVINDAVNEFETYRGDLKTAQNDDSTYYSTVILEGSKDNEIEIISDRLIHYHAYIAESASKKAAKKLVENWKEKIQSAVPDFKMTTIDFSRGKRKTNGYRFSKVTRTLCSISIVFSKREIDNYYSVLLAVTTQGKETLDTEGGNQE